jgi:CRISPR-associated endonuclease/helicase Cas3
MAETNPCEDGSTRWIETTRGILSISQIAPLLAERVLRVGASIARGEFSKLPLDEPLLSSMHFQICGDLVPDWAGRWRTIEVKVGTHSPPTPHLVPLRMRDYIEDLAIRIVSSPSERDLPELLAFAEGALLSIHPFADFNGRVTRLWLSEIIQRLRLAPLILAPEGHENVQAYLQALRAADMRDFEHLEKIWMFRLSAGA